MCLSSVALHVSALCLSPCLPREQGPGCALPLVSSGGTPRPKLEGCPVGGPVPRSPGAWPGLVVGGWPLQPLESCLDKPELWPGVELSPRLVYVAKVQGGACAHLLWPRGCWGPGGSGGGSSWAEQAEPWRPELGPWRRGATTSAQSVPGSFLRPFSRPRALPSASWAVSGASAVEAPGSATSPGGGISNVVPRVLSPGRSRAVVWTEAFAVKCSVSYSLLPPSA